MAAGGGTIKFKFDFKDLRAGVDNATMTGPDSVSTMLQQTVTAVLDAFGGIDALLRLMLKPQAPSTTSTGNSRAATHKKTGTKSGTVKSGSSITVITDPHQRIMSILQNQTTNVHIRAIKHATHAPTTDTIYINSKIAGEYDNYTKMTRNLRDDIPKEQQLLIVEEAARNKFILVATTLYELGYLVYNNLKAQLGATSSQLTQPEAVRGIRFCLVEDAICAPVRQSQSSIISLCPGQVVILGVFGIVADFIAERDGTVHRHVFYHYQKFDKRSRPSQLKNITGPSAYLAVLNERRAFDMAELPDDFERYESPPPESDRQRLGLGALNGTHQTPFSNIDSNIEDVRSQSGSPVGQNPQSTSKGRRASSHNSGGSSTLKRRLSETNPEGRSNTKK